MSKLLGSDNVRGQKYPCIILGQIEAIVYINGPYKQILDRVFVISRIIKALPRP